MSIRLAKKVGFCFGVRRAVEMAEGILKGNGRAYSLGSIIHNSQVVEGLSRKGLKVINNIDDAKSGFLVISSHGISPYVADKISKCSLKLVDTTCPFVSNAQKMARSLSEAGYKIVIAGDVNHPEVRALVDFAQDKAFVVKDLKDVKRLRLRPNEKIGVLSQTTQSMDNFLNIVRAIIETGPKELRVFNTICKDAEERQEAARRLAHKVDLMLIVGGKNSANTKRLLEVSKKILDNSRLVETQADLKDIWFKKVCAVGITSGASTPDWMVRRVVEAAAVKLKGKSKNSKVKIQGKEGCKR